MNLPLPVVPTAFFSEEHTKITPEEEEEEEDDVFVVARDGGGKKRRLATDQVRALERSFEEKNKLSPELKSRLAHDLGLHPRQVAVWFQNRRARWKTKQLELDFAGLNYRHEALRRDFDALRRENHALVAELSALKSKLIAGAGDEKMTAMSNSLPPPADSDSSAGGLTDDDGGLEMCTVDLFSDEHVPNLDWLCSDIAGNVAGAAIADDWLST